MIKTRIILISELLLLLLAIALFAQATYAYFTSQVQVSGTITSGSVKIVLYESAVQRDSEGNLVKDPDKPEIMGTSTGTIHDYGIVYPGQSIYKDPTIRNTGTNDAYIAAKISILDGDGDIHRVIGISDDYDEIDIEMLFSGGILDDANNFGDVHFGEWNGIKNVIHNERFAMLQVPCREESRYDIYVFFLNPMSHGECVTIFNGMHFSPDFTNVEMAEFSDLRIDICGFGVQTLGFESCFDAMVGALPEHFADFLQPA